MARFFNPEKGIWPFFGALADLLVLSFFWVLCSAPLVTAGAASAALYDAVVACFRKKAQGYLGRFFSTFRRELRSALLPTLLWAAVSAGLVLLLRTLAQHLSGRAAVFAAAGVTALLLLTLGICCWVFPLLSRFALGFSQLNLNALRLALGHILITFAMAFGCALAAWLTLRLALLPLFLLPALLALLFSRLLEPVFRQYEDAA